MGGIFLGTFLLLLTKKVPRPWVRKPTTTNTMVYYGG